MQEGPRNSSAARSELLKEGGLPMKFARTCAQLGAVLSVGFALALGCEHFAALLDAAITTALAI